MTALQRTALGIAAALLIALALLLPAALANAQEPPEGGTHLEPGVNLVGWVGEAAPVSQLFDEIPQLESIWAWDAELRDWIVAGRSAPEWLGGLGRITAGMGLRMQLGGDQPYLWQRSTEPTRGLVKLRTGWNLVAWSGADQTPIDDAVKGIGWSLRTVHRWNPTTQQWTIWTSPERSAQLIAAANADQEADDSEMPAIRRGEALWIEVARAVNWLQPTDILPRLVFPGGASQQLQARVREDLEAVLTFFRTQYGIQANPDFTIWVAKDVDALIQAWKDDGDDVDDARAASTRARWNRVAGWAGANIVVKQSSWPDDLSTDEIAWVRYTITHEYFHILQWQLSDSWASQWLVEGTASWIDDEHKVLDGERTLDNLRDTELSEITDNTPTLRSTESDNAQWEYTLGWLATDQLAADTAPDFPIEFWRQLTPTEIGPHGWWTSTPDWRTALHRVSGQTTAEFYDAFDAWQREQAATNAATADSYEYDGNWIRGRVTGDDGELVAGVFVNAIRVEGETSVGWNQRAETDADGSFAVQAPEDGDYRLSVNISEDCTRYYHNGELVEEQDDASLINVTDVDVTVLTLRAPAGVCGYQITGSITQADGQPLAGIHVSACLEEGGTCVPWLGTWADDDGKFTITVPVDGTYLLNFNLNGNLDGCTVHFGKGRLTSNRADAQLIRVAGRNVSLSQRQVPAGMCAYQIKGSIAQADGRPLADSRVSTCLEVGGECASHAGGNTDNDGAFAITVPAEGNYRLWFGLDGCTVYFRSGGFTATFSERGTARVEGRSVRLNARQISEDLCLEFRGVVLAWNGEPLAGANVVAGNFDAHGGGETDSDGHFAFYASGGQQYVVEVGLEKNSGVDDSCYVLVGDGRIVWKWEDAALLDPGNPDDNPLRIVLPRGVCERRINGTLTDANGTPMAGVRVTQGWGTDWTGTWTGQAGRFSLRVPLPDEYRVRFYHDNCFAWAKGTATTDTEQSADVFVIRDRDPEPLQVRLTERSCSGR